MTGQLIAAADGFVSANVHSSVSGTVTAVGEVPDAGGVRRPAITIAVEGDQWLDIIDRSESLVKECHLTRDEIITRIKNAGIVGMGGATFPTHVKLSVPVGKKAEFLIVNGVECEPFLTADHRVMLERGAEMLVGTDILSRALGVDKAYIGIENNKPDAIEHLRQLSAGYPDIEVEVIPGVTAALSGGAVLGAPLTHDFAVVSLSDRLTPWEKIEKRLRLAAEADFSLAIYNPASKGRPDYLQKACDILLSVLPADRICGTVENIGREGECAKIYTLGELRNAEVNMFTTVFIGNSMTKEIGGRMVTPRGYRI